jgi:hypothetical protein
MERSHLRNGKMILLVGVDPGDNTYHILYISLRDDEIAVDEDVENLDEDRSMVLAVETKSC